MTHSFEVWVYTRNSKAGYSRATLEEAKAFAKELRQRARRDVQRHPDPRSPLRPIVEVRRFCWVKLDCGHMRHVRDWDIMPALGRKRPVLAKCGCCYLGYGD